MLLNDYHPISITNLMAIAPSTHTIIIGILFISIGIYHFVNPGFFIKIMPNYIPNHSAMVFLEWGCRDTWRNWYHGFFFQNICRLGFDPASNCYFSCKYRHVYKSISKTRVGFIYLANPDQAPITVCSNLLGLLVCRT